MQFMISLYKEELSSGRGGGAGGLQTFSSPSYTPDQHLWHCKGRTLHNFYALNITLIDARIREAAKKGEKNLMAVTLRRGGGRRKNNIFKTFFLCSDCH